MFFCRPLSSARVLKTSSRPTACAVFTRCPFTYRNWPSESWSGALEAVAKGTSIRKAADEHGILKFTLWDHVFGRVLARVIMISCILSINFPGFECLVGGG